MKFKHLLAFPGGGIRGCVSAVYVNRLIESGNLDLNNVYSFSGCSTGAILAAALAVGKSPQEILDIYEDMSKEIFKPRMFFPKWAARTIFSVPYSTDRLLGVLKNAFGDTKLGEARNLVIVSWNLDGRYIDRGAASPLFLHSHRTYLPFDTELQETMPLYLAVGSSCAAPSYFDPIQFKSHTKSVYLADGGMVSNLSIIPNILVCASSNYDRRINLDKMVALVLGNGSRFFFQSGPTGGWKTPRMIEMLIGSIASANQILANNVMETLLMERYHNFDPSLPFQAELDDITKIDELIRWANTVDLDPVRSWLRGFFV
jgi:uncharacterized protein